MPNYRSGTEEEYNELTQLLEHISMYMRDFNEAEEQGRGDEESSNGGNSQYV